MLPTTKHGLWFGWVTTTTLTTRTLPHLDVSPPEAWQAHAGTEALQDAAADFNLLDAWRCMNGSTLEFTRFPSGQRAATDSKRRLDRTLVSAPTLDHSIPRVRAAWHIHPAGPLLYPVSAHGRPSDHAGVALTFAFSAQPKPEPRWCFPPRHLQDESMRCALERIILTCQNESTGSGLSGTDQGASPIICSKARHYGGASTSTNKTLFVFAYH